MDVVLGWFARRRLRRRLREAPVYRIAELPDDTCARITGRAESFGDLVEAPVTGRRCVFYVVEIWHTTMFDAPPRRVLTEPHTSPFELAEDDARVLVEPAAATISIEFDVVERGRPVFGTERHQALLRRHDLWEHRWPFIDCLEYREAIVAPGKSLVVLGTAERAEDAGVYREASRRRLAAQAITDGAVA